MRQVLLINNGEYDFTDFNQAVEFLEKEYGYEGPMWKMVVESNDLEILDLFLADDGLDSEIIEEED